MATATTTTTTTNDFDDFIDWTKGLYKKWMENFEKDPFLTIGATATILLLGIIILFAWFYCCWQFFRSCLIPVDNVNIQRAPKPGMSGGGGNKNKIINNKYSRMDDLKAKRIPTKLMWTIPHQLIETRTTTSTSTSTTNKPMMMEISDSLSYFDNDDDDRIKKKLKQKDSLDKILERACQQQQQQTETITTEPLEKTLSDSLNSEQQQEYFQQQQQQQQKRKQLKQQQKDYLEQLEKSQQKLKLKQQQNIIIRKKPPSISNKVKSAIIDFFMSTKRRYSLKPDKKITTKIESLRFHETFDKNHFPQPPPEQPGQPEQHKSLNLKIIYSPKSALDRAPPATIDLLSCTKEQQLPFLKSPTIDSLNELRSILKKSIKSHGELDF